MSRIALKKLTENKIISNFKFGTFQLGKQHYYSLELKKQCSIYFSNQLPFQQMMPKQSLILYHVLKPGFIEMLDTKFKTVFFCFSFFFSNTRIHYFFQAESYQKEIQRSLNKSTPSFSYMCIMRSKRTCTVTKWLLGKKKIYIYIYINVHLALAGVLKTVMFLCMFCLVLLL